MFSKKFIPDTTDTFLVLYMKNLIYDFNTWAHIKRLPNLRKAHFQPQEFISTWNIWRIHSYIVFKDDYFQDNFN